ncbi:MAG TPA: hypothetical protein VND64_34725 [Pirellulales bacterium]|nr:hypothetical protein [Pirellulales bacterium]
MRCARGVLNNRDGTTYPEPFKEFDSASFSPTLNPPSQVSDDPSALCGESCQLPALNHVVVRQRRSPFEMQETALWLKKVAFRVVAKVIANGKIEERIANDDRLPSPPARAEMLRGEPEPRVTRNIQPSHIIGVQ